MHLRQQLYQEHSKANTRLMAEWIGDDAVRFAALIDCFSEQDKLLVQRSSWVISEVGCVYPHLLLAHLDRLLESVANPLHPAVQRNILKAIAETRLTGSDEQEGTLVDICFHLIADPKTLVAAQVNAIQCILNRLPQYPELAVELEPLVEAGMHKESPAFRSKGKYALKQIQKRKKAQL